MSVDIVGSTAFKQDDARRDDPKEDHSAAWFSPIVQFYKQVELLFSQEWRNYAERGERNAVFTIGNSPVFWKGIGDEVVYFKELNNHMEAYCCLHCWMIAINTYRESLRKKYPKLDVKSTAWIAGFPVNNSEVILRTNVDMVNEGADGGDAVLDNAKLLGQYYMGSRDGLTIDFIGPNIDIGFRVSVYSLRQGN